MRRYILIQFALCLAFVGVLQAASPELTEKILTDGWSRKYSARKKLDALMASPGATQLKNQQAHLLALIHQRRYREALPIATRMSSATSAAQKEIWVSVVMRKYSAALASMQRMAGKVTGAPKKDQIKQAQFLGRMMGFLDGPVRKKTKQADRDRVRHEIEKNLGPLQTQFNQAHASVMKQYMGKVNELAKVITLGIEQEKKLRAQLKVDLEEIRKKNKDDQSRLDDKVEKTERQFRREESSLRKQDLPLQRELDRVDDAAVGLQIDRSRTVRRIWRELDWERERDRRRNRDGRRRLRTLFAATKSQPSSMAACSIGQPSQSASSSIWQRGTNCTQGAEEAESTSQSS